jgi:hypothetical protein
MTMRLAEGVIDDAFVCHAKYYGAERLWMVPYHVECWTKAREAFDNGSDEAFSWLYDELRKKWQVFRSKNYQAPTPERIRQILNALPLALRNRRLTDFAKPTPAILEECWDALTRASDIKRNVDGPSLVAITKFLHFWNPRLFVIADREVVWEWVFGHSWLWDQVERVRDDLEPILSPAVKDHPFFKTDLMDYLAVLVWGGRVLRANPGICRAFANYVERNSKDPIDLKLSEYEGSALEWLLLGLVELPPAGIIMEQ